MTATKKSKKAPKSAKPTVGPWEAKGCRIQTEIGERQVALCNGYIDSDKSEDTCFANARLIAAAPELLAICLKLRNPVYQSDGRPGFYVWEELDKVIAKATGKK